MKDKIIELLHSLENEEALKIMSEILDEEFDLKFASKIVLNGYEPYLTKDNLIEHQYGEGNEECGFVDLNSVLKLAEEVLNCDEEYGDVEFQYFVRYETEEEKEEEGHSDIDWLTRDTSVDIKDLNIQFEIH